MEAGHGPVLDAEAVEALLRVEFPQAFQDDRSFRIEEVGPMTARLRLVVSDRHLRPGGTVSGPSLFALADLALYVALLAQIGPVLGAVTTSMTLNFLRKPQAGRDLLARCRLLKLGKRLAVGEVLVAADGSEDAVAHATGTYAIPPPRADQVS